MNKHIELLTKLMIMYWKYNWELEDESNKSKIIKWYINFYLKNKIKY